MDLNSIMEQIKAGLTGDRETDIKYLLEQSEKYKNHKDGKLILRACSRLLDDLQSDEPQQEIKTIRKETEQHTVDVIKQVQADIKQKDYMKAAGRLEELLADIESKKLYEDDQVSEYHDFSDSFQVALYSSLNNTTKQQRPTGLHFELLYLEYGSLLVELKEYDKAALALQKGLRCNPLSPDLNFEYMEIFKVTGQLDEFYKLAADMFKKAYRPRDVARCYRNIGFVFIERQLWPVAKLCYLLSLKYDDQAKQALNELAYIDDKAGAKVEAPGQKEAVELAAQYGFPFGADPDVVRQAYHYGKIMLEDKKYESAKYYLGIAYQLAPLEEIRKLLEQISVS